MPQLETSWDVGIIMLSVSMAFLGSYSAVSLTELYRVCRRVKTKFFSPTSVLIGNAFAVGGAAIWSMHFVGMSALHLRAPDGEEIKVRYNLGLTILSLLAPILCIYMAMFVSTRDTVFILSKDEICKLIIKETNNMKVLRDNYVLLKLFLLKNVPPLVISGVLTGAGVLIMHYIGMMAMECDAIIKWNYGVVFVTVVVAVLVSFVGYWILFRLLSLYPSEEKLRVVCALVITVAVCAVHYIGMAAATYEYDPKTKLAYHSHDGMTYTVSQSSATTAAIVVAIVFNYVVSMSVQGELRSCYYRLLDFEILLHKTYDSNSYKQDGFMQKYKKLRRGYMRDMSEVAMKSSTFKFLDRSTSKVHDGAQNELESDIESRLGGSSAKIESSLHESSRPSATAADADVNSISGTKQCFVLDEKCAA